ncbi:MAG TPA: hypothetical protein P5234_03530 [Thermoanaerobaculaceae bacterium]|nr:hypothetical protein [Thermoanaerobaculaceae bacterium]HRS15303.1 hypothetical protein [Thermoanaerobaculaceae bacterium]
MDDLQLLQATGLVRAQEFVVEGDEAAVAGQGGPEVAEGFPGNRESAMGVGLASPIAQPGRQFDRLVERSDRLAVGAAPLLDLGQAQQVRKDAALSLRTLANLHGLADERLGQVQLAEPEVCRSRARQPATRAASRSHATVAPACSRRA